MNTVSKLIIALKNQPKHKQITNEYGEPFIAISHMEGKVILATSEPIGYCPNCMNYVYTSRNYMHNDNDVMYDGYCPICDDDFLDFEIRPLSKNKLLTNTQEHVSKLTLDQLTAIPADKIFRSGVALNLSSDIYMTDSNEGSELLWVAVKGYDNDWCIYIYWNTVPIEEVARSGDKIHSEDYIKKLVPCEDAVYDRYRR